jgi:hypothetical protein
VPSKTSNKTGIDYKALAPKYDVLFKNLDRAQWEIGKSLYEDGIVSDGARQRLAELIGREAKTLKTYYEVYVNFHERWPEGRPENITHGVLEQLNRLADDDARDTFLEAHAKPTRAEAELFVNMKIQEKTGRKPNRRSVDTTTVTVGGVKFTISVQDSGTGTVTVNGAKKAVVREGLAEGTYTLEFIQ